MWKLPVKFMSLQFPFEELGDAHSAAMITGYNYTVINSHKQLLFSTWRWMLKMLKLQRYSALNKGLSSQVCPWSPRYFLELVPFTYIWAISLYIFPNGEAVQMLFKYYNCICLCHFLWQLVPLLSTVFVKIVAFRSCVNLYLAPKICTLYFWTSYPR